MSVLRPPVSSLILPWCAPPSIHSPCVCVSQRQVESCDLSAIRALLAAKRSSGEAVPQSRFTDVAGLDNPQAAQSAEQEFTRILTKVCVFVCVPALQ